jgi:heme exporter protein A
LAGATPARNELTASNLSCVRGERSIFGRLGFKLASGGLLQVGGPNGTGKTSLLRMACGLLQPAAGTIEWNGSALRALGEDFHRNIAYVGHSNALKDELGAFENLQFAAGLSGLTVSHQTVSATLQAFGLKGIQHLPCRFMSQGQRRRLALARLGLSSGRALWILDEPFAALDAEAIEAVRTVIEEHLGRGGMALLTTHQEVAIAAAAKQRIELTS